MTINGRKMVTTFWNDFSIADAFSVRAIKDTFRRVTKEWEYDPVYMAELAIVTNKKCWDYYYSGNNTLAELYSGLYYKVRDIVYDDSKQRSREYYETYFDITD